MAEVDHTAVATLAEAGRQVDGGPELHAVRVGGQWTGGMRSVITAGRHTFVADEPAEREGEDDGPTPLQLVLSGLCACEAVTMRRMADKMRMQVDGFDIDAVGVIDTRGRKGTADVPAHFLDVRVHVRIRTPEGDERVARLRDVVERHCPVATLMQSAPLHFESVWERVP